MGRPPLRVFLQLQPDAVAVLAALLLLRRRSLLPGLVDGVVAESLTSHHVLQHRDIRGDIQRLIPEEAVQLPFNGGDVVGR